jgi:hypothetical protein
MNLIKVPFIYELIPDPMDKLLNDAPDLVEYERDGYLDLDSVIAAVEMDEYTEVYTAHQVFLLNLPLTDFMTKWML